MKRACWILALVLALANCRQAPSPEPPLLPPLPGTLFTVLGPVHVTREASPVVDGERVLGAWFWSEQRILVASDVIPAVAWHTLYHEQCHLTLDAAGVSNVVNGKNQEAVCDAIATARLRERLRVDYGF